MIARRFIKDTHVSHECTGGNMIFKHAALILISILISAISISGCTLYTNNGKEIPKGTLSVSELSDNPAYDTELKIYGEVSSLGELFSPSFELNSGGKKVQVWYALMVEDDGRQKPPVSIEGIDNGDEVIVTGELKTSGKYRSLNDFWASNIEKRK